GLGRVVAWHKQRGDAAPTTRQPDGQRPAHGLDLPVERELADDGERTEGVAPGAADRRQDAERDGQVERRALLADVGGREVDGDAVVGKFEARTADGAADALADRKSTRLNSSHT